MASYLIGNTQLPIDIYISAGYKSDPNQFQYDIVLKNVYGDFTFWAADWPQYMGDTYSIAVHVHGILEDSNLLQKNTLKISFND